MRTLIEAHELLPKGLQLESLGIETIVDQRARDPQDSRCHEPREDTSGALPLDRSGLSRREREERVAPHLDRDVGIRRRLLVSVRCCVRSKRKLGINKLDAANLAHGCAWVLAGILGRVGVVVGVVVGVETPRQSTGAFLIAAICRQFSSAPGRIRTSDSRFRKPGRCVASGCTGLRIPHI